jgi:hypothetical protein
MSTGRVAMPLGVAALLLLGACDSNAAQRAGPSLDLGADSMGVVPPSRSIPVRAHRSLVENSGAAMSLRQPGVWFSINDSGNEPELFAIDTSGAERGRWRIQGASNRDWEAIALGPCVTDATASAAAHCVYIGEIGDNEARHSSVRIYRVEEPDAQADARGSRRATALTFTYEGGPRDVEGMFAGPDGTLYFISKRKLEDASGRLRPALVYHLPARAWRTPDSIAVATVIDSLPIVPGTALGRQITDAAPSRDRTAVAVRTYTQLYVFRADSVSGRIRTDVAPTICSIAALEEKQGEGVSWFAGTGVWLLTSEGRGEPMWVVSCPPPDEPEPAQPR